MYLQKTLAYWWNSISSIGLFIGKREIKGGWRFKRQDTACRPWTQFLRMNDVTSGLFSNGRKWKAQESGYLFQWNEGLICLIAQNPQDWMHPQRTHAFGHFRWRFLQPSTPFGQPVLDECIYAAWWCLWSIFMPISQPILRSHVGSAFW